ncbi:MAG: thymidylate kinase [Oscillospiraceae bacterium]|nr:thymidylate kinase [Oscillospiraceae bacterium]
MGRLIVFEGIDGSGKSTQSELLRSRLKKEKTAFRSVTFPRYDNPSAALIKMYLGGAFGSDPGDVNAYAASCFYAVDRYASYKQDWREYYENGGLIVMDRYTTSNAIHQGAKLPEEQREEFFRWLAHFEYDLIGVPAPDLVLYMDIPLQTALDRIAARQVATGTAEDIHEKNRAYLALCHACGSQAADLYGWRRIPVTDGERDRSQAEIHEEIWSICGGLIHG